MLPINGIAQAQSIDLRFLPGNTFYVFSVEHITFGGSQKRDVVFGGSSLPRFVFVPIVDYPQMGKNYAPITNYGLAVFESTAANQMANASRPDGGLPMSRKLAIHCVEEIIENYRAWGVVDLGALTGLSRNDVAQVYTAVLPPYVTRPGLEAVKRAMVTGDDGKPRFLIDHVRLLDEKEREFEVNLHKLVEDVTDKNYFPALPAPLHEAAAKVQKALRLAIEQAIEYRGNLLNIETAEVAASKTNGGKGLTSYTARAKRYAASLGVELVDSVFVQKKEAEAKEAKVAAAPAANVEIPGLADAMNNLASAIGRMQTNSQAELATTPEPVTAPKVTPKTNKPTAPKETKET